MTDPEPDPASDAQSEISLDLHGAKRPVRGFAPSSASPAQKTREWAAHTADVTAAMLKRSASTLRHSGSTLVRATSGVREGVREEATTVADHTIGGIMQLAMRVKRSSQRFSGSSETGFSISRSGAVVPGPSEVAPEPSEDDESSSLWGELSAPLRVVNASPSASSASIEAHAPAATTSPARPQSAGSSHRDASAVPPAGGSVGRSGSRRSR